MNGFVISAIIIIIFLILMWVWNKTRPTLLDFTFEHTNILIWGKDHLDLLFQIQEYRLSNGLNILKKDDDMKILAQARTQYIIDNDIRIELHRHFFKHRQPYLDIGLESISENASYGYRGIFEQFKLSKSHNDNMLKEDWIYVGLSIRENHLGKNVVSLILAK